MAETETETETETAAETTTAVRSVLAAFVRDLHGRLDDQQGGSGAHELEVVLSDDTYSLESVELGAKPETYTEDHLIRPLLEAVGLASERQPYGERGGTVVWPDFEVTNVETTVIGESKPLNGVGEAVEEIQDYLDRKSIGAEYGIATDGIEWHLRKIELGGDFTEYPDIEHLNLRATLLAVAREEGLIEQSDLDADPEETIRSFVSVFERDSFAELLSKTAPREIRDRRKRDVETFYELYIELLFGESDEHDYETCLMDDIRFVGDREPSERDKRLFAITLMNRLLFVKFLETRGVLSEGFLRERVEYYERHGEGLAGNLYETQIRPLFSDLLNTPEGAREPKHRNPDSWFADVPYLNGGLFRANVADESRYRVIDRILPDVIRDLIEGSKLELDGRGFDPALLGSVFEKTINHIEQERTQKDIGAYYTPNDVTEIVTEQSVDPKIRDAIVETFAEGVAGDGVDGEGDGSAEDARAYMEQLDLSELLRKIEDGDEAVLSPGEDQTRIDFGDEEILSAVKDTLRQLKVLDPACGSGHFLTTAMDEIHRAQVSVLRGLADGEDPDPETRFAEKKALALDAIYGVDVDRIASEIAKLRVWLKIVEGNGWEPEFGKLPNIDVNITHGNSLVGLPLAGSFDDADVWDNDIGEIEQKRIEYKRDDEGDPREIERFLDEEIRPALDRTYLDLFSKPVETEIESVEAFDAVVESIEADTLYPTVSMVRAKREDGDAFDDEETERLEEMGFSVYTKSATRDVAEWERTLKTKQNGRGGYDKDLLVGTLRGLLEDGYVFSEVQRQPTRYDLDRIQGKPFHWLAEFPEVAEERGNTHSINFDIVLGNPPYGDLLSDEEKMFVSTYETSGIRDISANFVERQLQLLEEGGYFGNVTTLRLVYQSTLSELHDLIQTQLETTKIACFAKRPSHIFDNAQVRVATIVGKKAQNDGGIKTSGFIRFDSEDRGKKISDISYGSVDGLILGDKIGISDEKYAILPKVGGSTPRGILEKLKSHSDTVFRDVQSRKEKTDYEVWRMRHPDNWINPMLSEMYDAQDLEPMYFENTLKRDSAFLIMSSSLFYFYWMVYGNQRDLNWGQVEAFPYPDEEELEANADEIQSLAEELWNGMVEEFTTEPTPHYESMSRLKPLINSADELFGPMYGLDSGEIEFLKNYHGEYGRSGPENHQLDELEADD
ncbi:Eco57I restriction-modification methylase domain-containing protein [Halorussus salilacus]|uniref:Eco57I restriction-modification methylase domain-containing protein n=1 Tax=Halorussus salilacus TaxID=2953750 RepID=UPI0020A1A85F|nr:DNA methyltransferase [Halorussus salilacus]USZ67415.1 Eco57I restriction-modification methylase domain-containing protein [Halorussus salilacus]